MARKRSPERDKAREIWIESRGKLAPREVAEALNIKAERVRKWKNEDKWQATLDQIESKRKRGGQPGNKNAVGFGAPYRNTNAETHGAYSTVYLDSLPQDQREYIEHLNLDTRANMLAELQKLLAKELDLKNKIQKLGNEKQDSLFVDKVVHMLTPRTRKYDDSGNPTEEYKDKAEFDGENLPLKTSMKTIIKASPFDRTMKLETELDKTHGRIIKLLDSIKTYDIETRRVRLEEKKYNLAKAKLSGAYEVDEETGEINDENDNICADLEL